MAIRIDCKCGNTMNAPEMYAGTQFECPNCNQTLVIPQLQAATAAPANAVDAQMLETKVVSGKKDVMFVKSLEEPIEVTEFCEVAQQPTQNIARPGRNWLKEMMSAMLDPRSIHWMLMLGGGLMVLGIIIWFTSIGVFSDPHILGVVLTIGSLVIHLVGCLIILKTNYKLAGQALTFLSCFLVPLNLWFFHAHGVVTFDSLWMGGLVCCLLYVSTVVVLRDPLFLYAVEGGITLTSVLFLANLGLAADTTYLCGLLLALGFVSIHCERAFPADDSHFNRRRFGLPLFWYGHAQIGVALLLLLGTQTMGWLLDPVNTLLDINWNGNLLINSTWIAGTMWLVAAYIYLYSDFVVRRVGVYVYLAALSVLLAVISLVGINMQAEGVMMVLALASVIINVGYYASQSNDDRLLRSLAPLGLILSVPPIMLGALVHVRATSEFASELNWSYDSGWMFVIALAVVAFCNRVSAHVFRNTNTVASWNYLYLSAGAVVVGAAGLLRASGIVDWTLQLPLLMLIPIAYLIAARLWRGRWPAQPLGAVAHTATAVLLFHVIVGVLTQSGQFIVSASASNENLLVGLALLEAAVFYGLAAAYGRKGGNIVLASIWSCGAVWQFMCFIDLSFWETFEIGCVMIGTVLLITGYIGRFREEERHENDGVTINLWIGSVLASVTLLIAVVYHRFLTGEGPSLADELALLTVSIVMLVTGYSWQVKSTTLIGGAVTTMYLLLLVTSLAYFPQVAIGVYLAVGGAALFGIGLALSIYREQLLQLPERIANREGVFRVMSWR